MPRLRRFFLLFALIWTRNDKAFSLKTWMNIWRNSGFVYIGGTEHATGHLIYSRFWNKFLLFDLVSFARKSRSKKLINQGMIQGRSNFVYRIQRNQ